jgi:integrase/recombinase XerD
MPIPRAPKREDGPFHHVKPEYAEHSVARAVESGLITTEDARLIGEYIAEIRATHGIGLHQANKLTYALVLWRRFIGPYLENIIQDSSCHSAAEGR